MQLRKWAISDSGPNYYQALHWVTFGITSIYAIYHLIWDTPIIGACIAVSSCAALISVTRKLNDRAVVIVYQVFFASLLLASTLTCYQYGIRGLLFVFPLISILFYFFKNRYATTYALLFVAFSLAALYHAGESENLVRALPALIMTLLVSATYTQSMDVHSSRLSFVANHDALTNILNRRGFLSWLSRALVKAKRNSGDITLFFFDLDKFKLINDQYGHTVGDQILVSFTKRLISSLRSSEIIVEKGSIQNIGRLSGDEFVLALVGDSSVSDVNTIGERILTALDEPFVSDNVTIQLTASIGVAFASQTNFAIDKLLSKADEQMYRAKRQKLDSLSIAT